MNKLRIFVADDHPVVRNGLRGLISAQSEMEVVGEAADGDAALRDIAETKPDIVVMDVSMPGKGGAEATEELRRSGDSPKVVALTAHEDRGYMQKLLRAGASAFVVKRAAAEELVRAIRAVAAGETYIDPALAGQAILQLAGGEGAPRAADLSERESDVLQRIARGHAIKQIAAALDITVRTVETYKARGMEKMKLRTRADLVRFAVEQGWLGGIE